MVNLHGPKPAEGDSWLRYGEGVYEERGVVEDEGFVDVRRGVWRLCFACASLQPFESSGSGKLEPQAEAMDFNLQVKIATHDKPQWRLWSIMEAATKKGVYKKKPLR